MPKSFDEKAERALYEQLKPHATRRLGQAGEVVLLAKHIYLSLFTVGLLLLLFRDTFLELSLFFGERVQGQTLGFEETELSEDGIVWRVYYTYELNGKAYEGYSHSFNPPEGKIKVLVSPFNPMLAKIDGTSYMGTNYMNFNFLALLIISALWLWYQLRDFYRTRYLLTNATAVLARHFSAEESYEDDTITHTYNIVYKKLRGYVSTETESESAPEHALAFIDIGVKARLWVDFPYHMKLSPDGNWVTPNFGAVMWSILIFFLGSVLMGAGFILILSGLFGF